MVVVVDDLRWDDIGAAGHPFVETPHIDRIAREGARFLNAFATTPLCSPSRASILTGQYAHTHGIVDNTARDAASHRLPTFAVPLAQAGYRTAFIGKWHMGNDDSPRPGWSRWVAMRGQGEAMDPQLNIDGTRAVVNGYVTDVLTDHALVFLREPREAPFLLFLAHKALHPNVMQRDDGSTIELDSRSRRASCRRHGIAVVMRRRRCRADRTRCGRRNASQRSIGRFRVSRHWVRPRARVTGTYALAWRCCSAWTRVSGASSTRFASSASSTTR